MYGTRRVSCVLSIYLVRPASYLISLSVFSSPVIILSVNGIFLEGLLSASLIVYTISPKFCAESRSLALT